MGPLNAREVQVELDSLSGRANPAWMLSPEERRELFARVGRLSRHVDAPHGSPPLGYRGFLLRAGAEDDPPLLRVGGGVVRVAREGTWDDFRDTEDIEGWLGRQAEQRGLAELAARPGRAGAADMGDTDPSTAGGRDRDPGGGGDRDPGGGGDRDPGGGAVPGAAPPARLQQAVADFRAALQRAWPSPEAERRVVEAFERYRGLLQPPDEPEAAQRLADAYASYLEGVREAFSSAAARDQVLDGYRRYVAALQGALAAADPGRLAPEDLGALAEQMAWVAGVAAAVARAGAEQPGGGS